jgi:hypothetical protein
LQKNLSLALLLNELTKAGGWCIMKKEKERGGKRRRDITVTQGIAWAE